MATRRTTDPSRSTPPIASEETPAKRAPRKRSSKAAAAAEPAAAMPERAEISGDARRGMIAEAAYLRAERRGFSPGYELEDWLAAENEVDTLLRADHSRPPQ